MGRGCRRTVSRVVDGDTFVVRRRVGGSRYVRIAGIDTPERGERGYATAKRQLQRKIGGRRVAIRPVGRSYNRIVAVVPAVRRTRRRW
jgi:endonuclease YncB( thermonuclease family)